MIPNIAPVIPAIRREAFDDPAWLFDLKLDGFRGLADTIAARMISKRSALDVRPMEVGTHVDCPC
jgi:hypothetical protein